MVFLIWWLYCCWKVKSNACKPQNLYRWVSLYQTEKLLVLQWKLWRSLCGGKYTNSVLCFFLAVHHSLKKLDGVGYWSLLKFTSFQIMLLKQVKSMWFIMYVFFLDFSSSPSARRHLGLSLNPPDWDASSLSLLCSCSGIWLAAMKRSVLLCDGKLWHRHTPGSIHSGRRRACFSEQFFMFRGTGAVCLPRLEVVVSAFLETVDLSHMFIKKREMEPASPWVGVLPPCRQRCSACAGWLQRLLFCNSLLKIRLGLKFCGHIKATSPPLNWRWLGCKIWAQGVLQPNLVQQQMG